MIESSPALENVARAVFGEGVRLEGALGEPIAHRRINQITSGLERVELWGVDAAGTDVRARAIAKTLRRVAAGEDSDRGRFAPSDDPAHWNYWRREYDAYGSPLLHGLPEGFAAPRCYARELVEGERATLWLEEIEGTSAARWDDATFFRAGVAFGRWQGSALRNEATLPSDPWLCRSFLRAWAFGEAKDLETLCDDGLWSQAIVREHLGTSRFVAARKLAVTHAGLLAAAERAPAVLAHNDLWATNVFSRAGTIVAIDWAMLGLSTLTEDVVNLVFDSVWMFEVAPGRLAAIEREVFEGYYTGLNHEGETVSRSDLEIAFRRVAALRFGTLTGTLLRAAASAEKREELAHRYARSFEDVFAIRAAVAGRALDLV